MRRGRRRDAPVLKAAAALICTTRQCVKVSLFAYNPLLAVAKCCGFCVYSPICTSDRPTRLGISRSRVPGEEAEEMRQSDSSTLSEGGRAPGGGRFTRPKFTC
ncbi:hypothetical protein EVAR_85340_1 [Eumeta japonica]|uniref:Uncharacterized protein n=1 Tax=Eumeta variegata TaxID=151549 RepID=A0A4C1WV96_EUMVA|nr:hypothetical protein EVAR_85340_1 [Eumeta japonica]